MTARTRDGRAAAHAAFLRLQEDMEVWRLLLSCFRAGDATWVEVEEARREVDGAWDRYARAAGLPALVRASPRVCDVTGGRQRWTGQRVPVGYAEC